MTGPRRPTTDGAPPPSRRRDRQAFPGVLANDHVDFDLRAGEIHALLGENGAGKSTLMNILAGLYRPDEGEIRVDGRPVEFRSPRDAIAAGIGMVHQHFTLVPSQTVTENVLLGLDRPRFRLDLKRTRREVADSPTVGLRSTRGARSGSCRSASSSGSRSSRCCTAARGPDPGRADGGPRAAGDRRAVRDPARDGADAVRSVVFISHKLGEVLAIADRITVMRHGQGDRRRHRPIGATRADLARLMVGRRCSRRWSARRSRPGAVVLDVEDVRADNDRGVPALRGASLEVHAGEIVGIAAVAGNGQSELAEVITGLRTCTGRVSVDGRDVAARPAPATRSRRRGHVPEDRAGVGSAPNLSLVDNLILRASGSHPSHAGRCSTTAPRGSKANGLRQAPTRSRRRRSTRRSASCRAATSSGSSWPARSTRRPASWSPSSRRAASTSARSRASTSCSSTCAPRGPRSC